MKYADLVSEPVPQSQPLDERQVANNAGGFTYQLDDWARLDRFLILGSDSNTYYQQAKDLTRENAKCVERCYAADPIRTVAKIVEISDEGRAPKNDPAIFALAMGAASTDLQTRRIALQRLNEVCRTGTHLYQFVHAVKALGRGWGRTMKRAVARWYDSKTVNQIGYQAIKYRSRSFDKKTYTHKRLMQTAHPAGDGAEDRIDLYKWLWGKEIHTGGLPAQVQAHLNAMLSDDPKVWATLAQEHRLPWEALPTEANSKPEVWKALLPSLGLTAMIRNLGNLSRLEVIKPLTKNERLVVDRLSNEEEIRKARLHPFQILLAMSVYSGGKALRGGYGRTTPAPTWDVSGRVVDTLDKAFYKSFQNVVPTGKRTLIGLDVSSSMSCSLMGSPLSVCEAAAALAMVTMRTEQDWHIAAFADGMRKLPLTASMALTDVLKHTQNVNFGGTDCSLPMIYALEKGLEVDVFQVITDNETWAGREHPPEALRRYRKKTGINAKLIVVGMTSTGFTIADPEDPGMLDVVGFDTAAPAVMAEFARS